jgi:diguanylate cyclase (GGDEF)-like protein
MFHETLEREIARANRNQRFFCLLILDIDDFKKINDAHGHLVGDGVRVDLTRRIAALNRRGDVLVRHGGEEFGLLLPETELDGGRILAERICAAVAATPYVFGQKSIPYTVSIGLTMYNGSSPRSKDVLIAAADDAMYLSKRTGKNRVTVG